MSLDVFLRCPHCRHCEDSLNITHNLAPMAKEAGLYELLWRPEEIGVTAAKQLREPLAEGLKRLHLEPERFRKLNPENGWGTYDGLLSFVTRYLQMATGAPDDAVVEVSR